MTADSSMVQQLQSQGTFDQNQSFEDEWSMVNFANAGGLVVTSSSTGLEGGGSPQPESLTGVSFACAILEKAILDEAAGGQGNCKEVGSFKTGFYRYQIVDVTCINVLPYRHMNFCLCW